MEEKETLTIYERELKSILAKHYFWLDYQTKIDCYKTTSLDIELKEEKNKNSIQFLLKYDKKVDSFKEPIKKQYVITKEEVINIINEELFKEGYKIDNFEFNITYCINKHDGDKLNFIILKLKKKEEKKVKTKRLGWKKNV